MAFPTATSRVCSRTALGLTRSIEDALENVAEAHGLELIKQLDDVDGLFTKEFENSIYRIVQESLNNIIKHAAATQIDVRLTRSAGEVALIIEDNGQGFVVGATNKYGARQGGFGLIGIVERARLLGGQITIESTVGVGTKIAAVFPLERV